MLVYTEVNGELRLLHRVATSEVCPECGHLQPVCPECGRVSERALLTHSKGIEEDGRVYNFLSCRACGYQRQNPDPFIEVWVIDPETGDREWQTIYHTRDIVKILLDGYQLEVAI